MSAKRAAASSYAILLLLVIGAAATWCSGAAACDEIYVVKEGESLQTISEKCNDPFILEENTQIKDFDDVFPGLVLKITSPRAAVLNNRHIARKLLINY